MTEKTVQAVDRADEVKAQADAQASKQTQAIEKAWETLLKAGIITQDDRRLIEQRRIDRALLGLASKTLAEAGKITDGITSVVVVTEQWAYIADIGEQPRVMPRTTTVSTSRTRAPKASKASETNSKASDNQASKVSGAEDIPDHILRAASDALGLKWFGPSNARRSGKVLEKARELMGQGQA